MSEMWNRFFFKNQTSYRLQQLRRAWCLILILRLMGLENLGYGHTYSLWQPAFPDDSAYFLATTPVAWPALDWLPLPSLLGYNCLYALQLPLALICAWGRWGRIPNFLLATLFTYLSVLSQLFFHFHIYCLILVFWVLALAPGSSGNPKRLHWILPCRWLQLLVSTIYLCSGLSKLAPNWLNGSVLYLLAESPMRNYPLGYWLLDETLSFPLIAQIVAAGEVLMAFAIWVPRLRRFCLGLGVIAHITLSLTLNVSTFGLQMVALYLIFLAEPAPAPEG